MRLRPGGLGALPSAARRAAKAGFRAALRIPPVLTEAQIEIEMREAKVAVLPGRKTKMWTYGGSFPGPTIRRPAGEPTEVTFVHGLPAKAGELTVHLHGGHNRSSEDGQPGGLTAPPAAGAATATSPAAWRRRVGQRPADRAGRAAHLPL